MGVIPFLKRQHPEIEIFASSRAWEILGMPKAIETINRFNRDVAQKMGKEHIYDSYNLDWDNEIKGKSLSDGDILDLGELRGHIHETPGHSSCSISLYIPQILAEMPA